MIIPDCPEKQKQAFLNMINEVLALPYTDPSITRSDISTTAKSDNGVSVAWALDFLTGEIAFTMRRDNKVFMGKGFTCLNAFANKQEI
jgi:hypothetical protein